VQPSPPPPPEQVPAETQHARDCPSPQAGGLCCSPAPLPSATTSSTSSSQPAAANLSPKVTPMGPCTPGTGVGGRVGAHGSPTLQGSSGRRRGGSWPSASPPTSSTATAGPRWRWPRSAAWPESTTRSSSKTSTTKRVGGPGPGVEGAGGPCLPLV